MSRVKILNGKKIADKILLDLKKQIKKAKKKPGLAAVLVGDNPESKLYVSLKETACQRLNIYFERHLLPAKTSQKKIIKLIKNLNQQKNIHGIIVQLPLPKHLDTNKIISAINPKKDADGFHPTNLKGIKNKSNYVLPVLTQVILKLLKYTRKNFKKKTVGVICKSHTFLKPLQILLPTLGLKVIHAHPADKNLKRKTRSSDVLIVAVGKPRFIKKNFVKEDAIIIDVGITKTGKEVIGDVDFNSVKEKVSFITPVPGGVGPITVAYLLRNVYLLSN